MAQKARRDRRPPAQTPAVDAEVVAGSEPFSSDAPIGSGMETAAISDVTPEMMDQAAYKAAEAVEAAANPPVIQAGRDDEPLLDEPAPPATGAPDMFASSDHQAVNRDAAMQSGEDATAVMPVLTPSPVEAAAMSTLIEAAAASIDAELAAAEVSGSLATPTVEGPTAKVEAAERIGETLRWDLSSPGEALGAYGAQVVGMVAANIAANSHFLTALMSATSVTDVLALNTNHLRQQVELMTAQRRQLTTLARTIAFDAMKPFSAVPTEHGRDR